MKGCTAAARPLIACHSSSAESAVRILYLHQYFNTPEMVGGTRSYEMARRLVDRGHEVHMVTTWREKDGRSGWFRSEEGGIKVHWQYVPYSNNMGFGGRILAFLRFALGASRYASRLEVDLVFATSTPLTIAIPGIYAARRIGVPMVFEIRDLWPDVPIALGVLKSPLLKWLARRLELLAYENASRIVALAPGMKQAVVSKGVDPDIVDVIPNGADLALFHDRTVVCGVLRSRNGIPEQGRIVLYAGTLGLVNGVDFIVRLAAELDKAGAENQYLFVILGEGREERPLRQLARGLSVLGRTVFFMGGRSKREVGDWYHCCSASIMTYSGPELVYRDSVSNKFTLTIGILQAPDLFTTFSNLTGFTTIPYPGDGQVDIEFDPPNSDARFFEVYGSEPPNP